MRSSGRRRTRAANGAHNCDSILHEAFITIAPFDVAASMSQQVLGHFDPTGTKRPDRFDKVHIDASGSPVAWRFSHTPDGFRVRAVGDGAADALRSFLRQFPLRDGCAEFAPAHPVLRRLALAYAGLRLMRMPWLFDVAAGAVLQQRVRWQVAYTDFRRVAQRWGTPTRVGVAFPSARTLATLPVAAIEAAGIDPKRARALAALARLEASHPFLDEERDFDRLRRRLTRLPGIGPWTANMIAGYGAGDPDAVPVGDLHLPALVTWALAGEPEGSDARMLELLEPYRGQRFRVIRLLSWAARRAPHAFGRLPDAAQAVTPLST